MLVLCVHQLTTGLLPDKHLRLIDLLGMLVMIDLFLLKLLALHL